MKQTTALKDLLSFQGEWRSYQKRVLDHADNYLKDGRIHIVVLRNTRYLGDDYYPAIICREVFEKAEEERQSRARKLGRVWELKTKELPAAPMSFTMGRQTKAFNDPYEQAEYEYSLIESETNANERE